MNNPLKLHREETTIIQNKAREVIKTSAHTKTIK